MSFDSLIMAAVTAELNKKLTGASVQRVYEPERNLLVIHLYSGGEQPGLLFSLDPQWARVHKTDKRYRSNIEPSPFCMLLRKYLVGARVTGLSNPPLERILHIDFDPPEGMPAVKLIAEIMGRRSNLILLDNRDYILGAFRMASWEKNPLRAIFPGEKYIPVPPQKKLNPLTMDYLSFSEGLQRLSKAGQGEEQALINLVKGLSPLIAQELFYRSLDDDKDSNNDREEKLFWLIKNLFSGNYDARSKPVMLPDRKVFAAIPLQHLKKDLQLPYDSVNLMLEHFYDQLIASKRIEEARRQLQHAVSKRLAMLQKKRAEQQKEMDAAEQAEQHRLYGELLLAYSHQVSKGTEHVVLPHLYNQEEMVTVPLDPAKSVSANAQQHFSRYQKAKKGQAKIRRQLHLTAAEIEYCQGLIYTIESSSEEVLEEVGEEMIAAGYIRRKGKEKRKNYGQPKPLTFKTSTGHTVLLGRNNRQNDYVTFKAAVRRDTWLHVRQLPGSHVILKEVPYPPPPEDLEEAAFLAAYFSKGRTSKAVEVDYTEVRHVRRRPGGKPGFVFYENYKTITVNPQNKEMLKQFGLEDH